MQFQASEALEASPLVARISWSADEGCVSGPHRVLPDGCTDLLLSRDEESGAFSLDVFGVKSTALVVSGHRPVERLGIHLRPGAARSALGVPAAELRDGSWPLEALWGARTRRLEDQLANAPSWRRRAGILIASLGQAPESGPPHWFGASVRLASDRHGRLTAKELAQEMGVGLRTLERCFRDHVGIGPKAFAQQLRFHSANEQLSRGTPASRVALESGYADQPHMVRDFRRIAGVTPSNISWERGARRRDRMEARR